MSNFEDWKQISLVVHVFILPIFGLVALILNSISTFTNLGYFISRPTYEYNFEPYDPEERHVYVLSLEDCKTNFTENLVDFANGLNTKYYTFVSVICFLFSLISFMITHSVHFAEHYYEENHQYLTKANRISIIFSILSFLFSVPAQYPEKIEFKDCLVVDGVLDSFADRSWEFICNFGLWSIFILPTIIFCWIENKENKDCFENKYLRCAIGVMAIYILLFIIMAFATKFGYVIAFKLGWDISITLNLVTGVVAIWFNCWKIAEVDVGSRV